MSQPACAVLCYAQPSSCTCAPENARVPGNHTIPYDSKNAPSAAHAEASSWQLGKLQAGIQAVQLFCCINLDECVVVRRVQCTALQRATESHMSAAARCNHMRREECTSPQQATQPHRSAAFAAIICAATRERNTSMLIDRGAAIKPPVQNIGPVHSAASPPCYMCHYTCACDMRCRRERCDPTCT